ncbi:MAG: HEAT repeat domain-containing protein [Planctomycetota bacterium]
MGLIELCLLSLVSPQQPAAQAPPAVEQVAPAQDPQGPREQLAQLEKAGEYADAAALGKLALGDDEAIAARAAWLLAHSKNAAHLAALPAIIESSPFAEARLQALQGILLHGDASATSIAIGALEDLDRRVRTLAVKVLGKLRRPASIDPLLQLVRTESTNATAGTATDVKLALLTLADLGASQHLLRIAAGVGDGNPEGCGDALTYTFQTLSPKLDADKETTVLVAVLDHKETLLRRYAITRLTELGDPKSATALQGRLAKEDEELRPLLEVAIAQLQGEGTAPPEDELERATHNAKVLGTRAADWWNGQPVTSKAMFGAIPVALIVMLWLLRRAARRRAHEADAQAAAALVAPSDEYLEDQDSYDDGGYEDGAYDDEAYEDEQGAYEDDQEVDEQYDDEAYEGEEYDTEGWEDDQQAVSADGAALEDERFQ